MRKFIGYFILAAVILTLPAGCARDRGSASSSAGASSVPPAQSAAPAASEEIVTESPDLSVSDARGLLSETIDTDAYLILDGGTQTEVDGQGYYVFLVASKKDNAPVGQVAVNKRTGEKFNYEGEGKLGDYADFQLYDPAVDAVVDWEGVFTDGTRTLELIPMDERSFEYLLDDCSGVARGLGNTATDEESGLTFTYQDGVITLSGAQEGAFTRAG